LVTGAIGIQPWLLRSCGLVFRFQMRAFKPTLHETERRGARTSALCAKAKSMLQSLTQSLRYNGIRN